MNKINLITFFNKLMPKYKRKVVFYGRTRYDGNNHALAQYMINNGYKRRDCGGLSHSYGKVYFSLLRYGQNVVENSSQANCF